MRRNQKDAIIGHGKTVHKLRQSPEKDTTFDTMKAHANEDLACAYSNRFSPRANMDSYDSNSIVATAEFKYSLKKII